MIQLKLPEYFFRYFIAIVIVFLLGICLIFLQDAIHHPDLEQRNTSELEKQYTFEVTIVIPALQKAFPLLLFSNGGVALFILLVPLYWIGIWWFKRDLLNYIILLMQATVFLLIFALGHNTFSKLYEFYKTMPFFVFVTFYYPHGIFEILAFILSGTFSLIVIDAVRKYLHDLDDTSSLHPGDICIFILRKIWMILVIIILILTIAAAIECWITPSMVTSTLKVAISGVSNR